MTNWIVSANGKKYDHASAFAKWGYIDWVQTAKYTIGDIVYIYCTVPYKKVMYKAIVTKTNMMFLEHTDDKEYWSDLDYYNNTIDKLFARLKLIEQVNRDELNLTNLKLKGLASAPQRPVKVSDELSAYIDSFMKDDYSKGVFPESDLPEDSYEGAVKSVQVNRYERSSIARQKCIEYYGCKCYVCGMEFEDIYGEIGKGFIHVHHLIPLNEIGKEYVVDYIKDLRPVCPNCHAMLHRSINGKTVSIDELKSIIENCD